MTEILPFIALGLFFFALVVWLSVFLPIVGKHD
jgi:hypothetical protein